MCMYVHRMGERGRGRERERAHVHHLHKRVLTELFQQIHVDSSTPPCRQIQKKMLAKQFQHSSKYQGGLPGKFGSFVPDVS